MTEQHPEVVDLHSLVREARNLKSESGENPEYDRALVELIADTTGHGDDAGRALIEQLVLGRERSFEVRGTITIEYAMGFSEIEAREWFPDVDWSDNERSHAGDIETDHLDSAPKDFWDAVRIKRDVVLSGYVHETSPTNGWGLMAEELRAVIEL